MTNKKTFFKIKNRLQPQKKKKIKKSFIQQQRKEICMQSTLNHHKFIKYNKIEIKPQEYFLKM